MKIAAGEIRVLASPEEVSRAAAHEFVKSAAVAVGSRDRFTVALSGGSTPKRLYQLLASADFRDRVSWQKVHFFWGDERHVPPTHPDSNYRMANEAMLSKLPVPAENIHRMMGEDPDADRAARAYEGELRRTFNLKAGEVPRFDLVLLGIGPDGHTASLFPGASALMETGRLVVEPWVEKFKAFRITLTLPVLNAAALVLFLVAGEDKAEVLKKILTDEDSSNPLPAQSIRPAHGILLWLVDRAAAKALNAGHSAN